MTTATDPTIYDPDILQAAYQAALTELGDTWYNALTTGAEWLALRATVVIEPTDDEQVLIVNSTNGKRYTVDRQGQTCGCPAYQQPLLADKVEDARPCKHRGAVIVENYYLKLQQQAAAAAQYRETFSREELPYIAGADYPPLAWVGTAHEADERLRLGDQVVDAAIAEAAERPAYDRQADIDARTAHAEQERGRGDKDGGRSRTAGGTDGTADEAAQGGTAEDARADERHRRRTGVIPLISQLKFRDCAFLKHLDASQSSSCSTCGVGQIVTTVTLAGAGHRLTTHPGQ